MQRKHIPNALTVLRLCLVPVIPAAYFCWTPYAALALYAFACFTDVIDGWLARKWGVSTSFGVAVDPLADKLTVFAVAISLSFDWPWLWCVAGLLLVKDGLMIIGGIILYFRKSRHKVFPANWTGKAATVMLWVGLTASFFGEYINPWHYVLTGIGVVLAIAAFFSYLPNILKVNREAE